MLILKEAEYLKFFDYNYEISHIVDLINSIQVDNLPALKRRGFPL